jgi:DNA-binding LytR/AlgR family response regulator
MSSPRILAIEDNAHQADVLKLMVDQLSYVLIDIVDNPAEALRLLKTTKPDVLLVDIDLGDQDRGIDMVKKINDTTTIPVIYLTTFRSDEIFNCAKATIPEAFINKPCSKEHLKAAIDLAILRRKNEVNLIRKRKQQLPIPDSIFIKVGTALVKLQLNTILLVEACDKYCYIYHNREKKHLLNVPLKKIIQHLPPDQFIQVHRSYVANLQAIDIVRLQQNCIEIAGRLAPVSKAYRSALLSRLKML